MYRYPTIQMIFSGPSILSKDLPPKPSIQMAWAAITALMRSLKNFPVRLFLSSVARYTALPSKPKKEARSSIPATTVVMPLTFPVGKTGSSIAPQAWKWASERSTTPACPLHPVGRNWNHRWGKAAVLDNSRPFLQSNILLSAPDLRLAIQKQNQLLLVARPGYPKCNQPPKNEDYILYEFKMIATTLGLPIPKYPNPHPYLPTGFLIIRFIKYFGFRVYTMLNALNSLNACAYKKQCCSSFNKFHNLFLRKKYMCRKISTKTRVNHLVYFNSPILCL